MNQAIKEQLKIYRDKALSKTDCAVVEMRDDGFACFFKDKNLFVIVSIGREDDSKLWIHVSISKKNPDMLFPLDPKYPTWDELKWIKYRLLGNVTAYQIMPKTQKHVNIHNACFHFFHCLECDEYLPDFTHGGLSI